MNIISIVSVSVIGVFLVILLREVNSGYILPVSIVLCGLILLSIYPLLYELFSYSRELMGISVNAEDIKLLYKAIATAFIVQYASDLSRECGVDSVASKLEIAGKIYMLSLCLPLVKNLLSTVINI